MPEPIHIQLELLGDDLDPRAVIKTARELQRVLEDVEEQITHEKPKAHWRWTEDAILRVSASPNGLSEGTLRKIVSDVRDGLETLQIGPERKAWPRTFGHKARKAVQQIATVLPQVQAIKVEAEGVPPFTLKQAVVSQLIAYVAQGFTEEVSSVDGVLDLISVRGHPHFSIEEHGTGRRIKATFGDAIFGTVKDALGRRVVIQGTLRTRADGTPVSIRDVTYVYVRPRPTRDIESLMGAIPDFTDGVNAGEYVRRLREGE